MSARLTLRDASLRPDPVNDGLILRLGDESGRLGLGEAVARPGFSPSMHAIRESVRASRLTERMLGRSFVCTEEAAALSAELCGADSPNPLPSPLRFAIDSALLDLLGHARGCTVAALLGTPAPQIRRNALVHIDTDRNAIETLQRQGFTTVKVKARGPWPHSLHQLEAIARMLAECSPATRLRIDCNGSMPLEGASELLHGLTKLAPEYVEEPFKHLDPTALRALLATDFPLAIDESAVDQQAWHEHLDARVAAVAVIKPAFVGGLFAALKRVQEARSCGLEVVITSALEGEIGVAAAAHLALAIRPTLAVGISARPGTSLPPWLAAHSPIVHHPMGIGLCLSDPGGLDE